MSLLPVVAIASDHAGVDLKHMLVERIRYLKMEPMDLGPSSSESVDYPDFAALLCATIGGEIARIGKMKGVLICGTGIGMSIAANRYPHIRAALCAEATSAVLARKHNDANVLVLGARVVGVDVAKDILDNFLLSPFSGESRHAQRIEQLWRLPRQLPG